MARKLDPVMPGEILLEEFLQPLGISQNQIARDIQVPVGRISDIIHGRRGISPDTALRLSIYFQTTPEFWMNLQTRYDLKKARQNLNQIRRIKRYRRRTMRRSQEDELVETAH